MVQGGKMGYFLGGMTLFFGLAFIYLAYDYGYQQCSGQNNCTYPVIMKAIGSSNQLLCATIWLVGSAIIFTLNFAVKDEY